MSTADPVLPIILAFLDRIGIAVVAESLSDTFLPGLTVRRGTLVYDPEALIWPGDLLHEAGHIAVTDPALRNGEAGVSDDPGEEMAAMAWSYAAAIEIDVDPAIVFHSGGYLGGGANFMESYTRKPGIGVPMLQYYGMTEDFPVMTRWLR